MIRVNLPAADVERLERTFRTTSDAKLRHRVQVVLMAHRGRPHGDIATDLACSRSSVQRWLNAYLPCALDGLPPGRPPGAKPKLPPDLPPLVRQWVINGPARRGL